jgi:hypothetical protein
MLNKTRVVNEIGLGLQGDEGERMKGIRVFESEGAVEVWVEVEAAGESREVLQYLSPIEAMKFSQAFERCAIAALKNTR